MLLSLKEQFQARQGVWSKYNNLDFFDSCKFCNKEAEKVDLTKVDLNAKGQDLISEIENMCCFPIVSEEEFLNIWAKNNWTMVKFLKEHMDRKHKHYNPWQVVSCRL